MPNYFRARRPKSIDRSANSSIARVIQVFFGLICLFILGFCTSQIAYADEALVTPSQSQTRVYERDFFDRFNPQSARDIVERIPGFSFDAGDTVRGFSAGAGNVLVDGVRPASKTGGLEEALARIPANDVARVEVISGAIGTSEASGQSLVANIIRSGAQRTLSWRLEVERNSEGVTYPRFETALTNRTGAWRTSSRLNVFWEQFDLVGRRDRFDSQNNLTRAQIEDRPSVLTEVFGSSEASRPLGGGKLTLNGRLGYSGLFLVTDRFQFDNRIPDDNPDGRSYIDRDRSRWTAETSIDWSRTYDETWNYKALFLTSIEPLDQITDVRTERPVQSVIQTSELSRRETPIEAVFRSTVGRVDNAVLKPDFGLEVAYNRLDADFDQIVIDEIGNVTTVDLPASDVLIEEVRAEAFSNLIWSMAPKWTFESGLAVEVSEISVSGDASNRQTFVFAKPFANLSYSPTSSLQARLSARRSVGQLDFSDFAASAQADVDRQFGGNPDLGPDQNWRSSFEIDWRSEAIGAANVEFFHEWREDVLEQIALPSGAFGLANAGKGRVWGIDTSVSLKVESIVPGGLLELSALIRDSEFDDPLTGERRSLTNISSPTFEVSFRQDLTRLQSSWGINYTGKRENEFFFGNEFVDDSSGSVLEFFVETNRYFGVKSRLSLRGVGDRALKSQRSFFAPDRSGVFTGAERVNREQGLFVNLSIEGQR